MLAVFEASIAENGGRAIPRRPFADAEAAGQVERFDPFAGYERFVRRTLDLERLKAADMRVLVEPDVGRPAPAGSRAPRGRPDPRSTEIHTERNP